MKIKSLKKVQLRYLQDLIETFQAGKTLQEQYEYLRDKKYTLKEMKLLNIDISKEEADEFDRIRNDTEKIYRNDKIWCQFIEYRKDKRKQKLTKVDSLQDLIDNTKHFCAVFDSFEPITHIKSLKTIEPIEVKGDIYMLVKLFPNDKGEYILNQEDLWKFRDVLIMKYKKDDKWITRYAK